MFSGKTPQLITIYQHNKIADIATCVINYEEENRYHDTMLSSHDKRMIPCLKLRKISEIFDKHPAILQNTRAFIINEGQFFEDLYEGVTHLVNDCHKIMLSHSARRR